MPENDIQINALIVDDEIKACANLKCILTDYVDQEINIVGIAQNTKEAEIQIQKFIPNIIFLDIEMPNEDAFHFLDRISPFQFEVIFITAYDEYAVRAFKLNAVDYILKPISINELKLAVKKLKERLTYKNLIENRNTSFTEIAAQVNNKIKPHKITLKGATNVEVIDFKDICFVEAQSSYSKIFFFKKAQLKEMIMSNPLSDYEELLPASHFYRIHRSYLINCAHIKKIFHDGTNQIMIKDDFILPISRRRYPLLIEFLKNNDHYDN